MSFALTSIKGVGRRFANMVCKKAEVDLNKRCERSFLPLHFGLIAGSELPILSSLSQIEICVRLRDDHPNRRARRMQEFVVKENVHRSCGGPGVRGGVRVTNVRDVLGEVATSDGRDIWR